MHLIYLFLVGFASIYALWVFYLAIMNLKRAKIAKLLNKPALILGTPVLFVGYVFDAFVNVFVMTVLLFELPQELTVTARLKRHINEQTGWRCNVAKFFIPLLDPFDPSGHHITPEQ